jgi:hypothetical protein
MMLVGSAFLVAGCATGLQPGFTDLPCDQQPADQVVELRFDADGCPKVAVPRNFDLKEGRGKFICWVSADMAGKREVHDFKLYFDPFVGSNHTSGGNGLFRKQIDGNAPVRTDGVEYKYTVSGEDCPGGDTDNKYLDPRFTVRR